MAFLKKMIKTNFKKPIKQEKEKNLQRNHWKILDQLLIQSILYKNRHKLANLLLGECIKGAKRKSLPRGFVKLVNNYLSENKAFKTKSDKDVRYHFNKMLSDTFNTEYKDTSNKNILSKTMPISSLANITNNYLLMALEEVKMTYYSWKQFEKVTVTISYLFYN